MANKGKAKDRTKLDVPIKEGEETEVAMARVVLGPEVRNAFVASTFASTLFGDHHKPSVQYDVDALREMIAKAKSGDKALASRMLASQAISLDAMFTELARRSHLNMGEYVDASERYMRLALKAQTGCRATLETLAKLHQPREQTVKHVHVNDGGQAVVADQIHQHSGGQNEKSVKQSHATGAAGESAPLPSQDPQENGVPIPSGEGKEEVPNARRD